VKNWPFRNRLILTSLILISAAIYSLMGARAVQANRLRQQPTVAIATVTGTPLGPMVAVNGDQDMINVHNGPGQSYPVVGVLVANQKAPAIGMDREGQWIEIKYMGVPGNLGWVSASLVTQEQNGTLPIVSPASPPQVQSTATLEPTLAARYIQLEAPTRLPTFTPAAPLVVPTFAAANRALDVTRLPIGFVIVGLGVIGFFGTLLSLLRSR
jgi:uncharacterized protein YraI